MASGTILYRYPKRVAAGVPSRECARSNPSSRDFLAVEEGVGSGSDLVFGGTWRGSRTLVGMHRVRDGHSAGGKELVGVNHLPLTFCPVYENFVNFLETLHFAIELNNCVTTKKIFERPFLLAILFLCHGRCIKQNILIIKLKNW